ncbi:MAG: hypothetical protein KGP14_02395 [Betaproteobacteria bacterium]|nr:hypothetical protein [Betaproteobacteria bacterium]
MARRINITRNEAETWVFNCLFYADDGTLLNITGATEIEWATGSDLTTAPLFSAKLSTGMFVITNATGGAATMTATYAQHSAVTPGIYQHDCRVTLASGEVTQQFYGNFKVTNSLFVPGV